MSSIITQITPELIQESVTYQQYRNLINDLLAQGKTTGQQQNAALIEYTRMNVRRMERWDKTAIVSSELQHKVSLIDAPQTWLVLTEAWCGDAAQSIPFMVKVARYSPLVAIRFILRGEHPDIMDAYLTNGGRSIPKLIALNEDLVELFTWGPRPQVLQQQYLAYRKDPKGISKQQFIESIHLWYARDKNATIDAEFLTLIE
ncbi:MAG TPA: thioredoxin family protein [Cyclobacteriaceae bacterium]|nr:thioredoxin family protein [Cyclobacteriaceae bacterium]